MGIEHVGNYLPCSIEACCKFLIDKQRVDSIGKCCELSDVEIVGIPMELQTLEAKFYFKCSDHVHLDTNEKKQNGLHCGSFEYQWYIGSPVKPFTAISGATSKVQSCVQ